MTAKITSIDYKGTESKGKATVIIEGTPGDTKQMIEKIRFIEI